MPVRIWGLLVDGELKISILGEGVVMNRWEYAWLVEHRFSAWLAATPRPLLIQDGEKCLWTDEALAALDMEDIEVFEGHPPASPDLNAIENAWALLRDRLYTTEPSEVESRTEFCQRLRLAVAWLNRNHQDTLRDLCRNQKERARDVLLLKGARTQW
jgi:hypothetical protein